MSVQSESTSCVLDCDQALARLGGDRELYEELIGFVLEDAPLLFLELTDAVASKEATAIRMKAHSLKGLAAGCGGVRAASAAQKVETAGEKGNLDDIADLVDTLRDELNELILALRGFSA